MGYTIKKNYAHKSNYGESRSLSSIEYCVWHYTGNDGDTDEANAKYFTGANRQASAHRFIDDDSVTCSVKFSRIAWHCGSETGKYYHDKCRNYNSIGIELCDTKHDGKYNISAKTRANAVAYGKTLAVKYGFKQSEQLRHYDVTHKKCPAYWAGANNSDWDKFKADLYEGYFIGKKYTLLEDRKVRPYAGCSNKVVKRSELTTALQKCTTSDCGSKAILRKGVTVTCKDVQYTSKGHIYIKIASGWICVKGSNGTYVKEKK